MTDVSMQMYDKLCKYCGNCDRKHCLKDVPYYAVSIFCDSFVEKEIIKIEKPKLSYARRRIIRSLVETF